MYSQFNIDNIIYRLFNKKDGFFVEVGVCHPIEQNNTFLLEMNGWKGLLIEPSKMYDYSIYRPNSIVENTAMVSKSYNEKFIYFNDTFDDNGGFTSTVSENNEFDNKVPCDTLNNTLNKYNIKTIDFLSIDVEGYENQVMDGLDVNNYDIRSILIETHDKNKLPFIKYESNLTDFDYLCESYTKEILTDYHILFIKNK